MKVSQLVSSIAIAALTVPSAGLAASQAGQFFVTPSLGAGWFDSSRKVSNEPVLDLSAGYNITDSLAVAVSYAHAANKDELNNDDMNMNQFRVDGLYRFMPKSALQPYLLAGVGRMRLRDSHSFLDYGVGVTYDFMQNVALDARVRRQYQLGSTKAHDTIATVGIQFSFGGGTGSPFSAENYQAEQAPAPSNEPVTAAAPAVSKPQNICATPLSKLDVHFASSSAEITDQYRCGLERIAAHLKQAPKDSIMVKGYADNSGSPEYNNLALSQQRADSVKHYFVVTQGINSHRVVTQAMGTKDPIASNATVEGRTKNRRVEISVIK